MSEDNKTLLRRMVDEVIVGGKLELLDELIAPSFVNHNLISTGEAAASVGIEGFKQEIAALRVAFPDITIAVDDLLADGDKIIARMRTNGTHKGDWAGIPPTGKVVSNVPSISIVRIADGKFVERWNVTDRLTPLQQLGIISLPR
jgi:predicted ester cyclase